MSEEPVCGLCGLPGVDIGTGRPFFGASVNGTPLHHGQLTRIVGWCHQDGRHEPIMTTCYRAYTVYGHRPGGQEQEPKYLNQWLDIGDD